ncbi:hypothetical protein Ple7327_0569 [Pleurocapsa sp. PCC 7327]|nr:hypothetical protein Ple7327_0569 [Pleurocapsa sp. PCC 7327]
MKSLIFSSLSVLMLSFAIAASTNAQSEPVTPFNFWGVRGAISPALYSKSQRRDTWTPRARRWGSIP